MIEIFPCLNSEWQGCDNPVLESGSRYLAEELFGAHQYLDFGPSDSDRPSSRAGVFALAQIAARFVTVLETLRRESPNRVFTVAGTCGAEVAPVAYLNERYRGRLGVVWFDAHGDMNTPESSPSGHFHGMVLRTLLGEGPDELLGQMHERLDPSRLVLAGTRDLDEAELQYVDSARIRVLEGWSTTTTQSIIAALNDADVGDLYVHIDVDVFDPESFDDALFSMSGGPTLLQVADAITALSNAFDIVGAGIVEYCGKRDGSASRLCEFLGTTGLWPSTAAGAWKESRAVMPKPPSLRQLVEQHVVAELQARGFTYEPARIGPTFRRTVHLPAGTVVQIVEFQYGVKMRSFGKFTVNLGVYSPELTYPPRGVSAAEAHSFDCMFEMLTRLAHILPPCPEDAPVSSATGDAEQQSDEWWSYRGSPRKIKKTLERISRLLKDRAEPWFQAMSTEEQFRQAHAIRAERAARLQEDQR